MCQTENVQFAWHIHHDILIEPLLEPIEKRRRFIRKYKSVSEHELRLRLLQPVRGQLPERVVETGRTYAKANKEAGRLSKIYNETYRKAGVSCVRAKSDYMTAELAFNDSREAYGNACQDYKAELGELHGQECPDCPWDGKTIFSAQSI